MHFISIWKSGALILIVALMSACAGVPPEQLSKMATVDAGNSYSLHSVDSKAVFFGKVHVMPGKHVFEIVHCYSSNNCTYETYRFNAEAGYLYRLMPNRTILVLDRNDQYLRKVDELTPIGGNDIDYATRKENQEYNNEAARLRQAAWSAQLQRRKHNLPLVRKLGTRICQLRGQILYIGYVESFSDEKIQIRVAEAVVNENHNVRLADFTPNIIWDSPLSWDLCE